MTSPPENPLRELTSRAFAVACPEIGGLETLRVFEPMMHLLRFGNYVEDRKALFAGMTAEDFDRELAAIKARREAEPPKPPRPVRPANVPLPELTRQAFAVVSRELGVEDACRVFEPVMHLLSSGDPVEERPAALPSGRSPS